LKLIENNNHFDLVFTGWGASTCILMIEMEKKSLLENKNILIIEPSDKLENDKTFCFWAEKDDEIYQNFKSIISNSWTSIQINDSKSSLINPVEYFHVDSKDLYNWSRRIIEKYNIEHRREKVDLIQQYSKIKIKTSNNQYISDWVFDSRPPNFKNLSDNQFNISQSFFGLKVNFNEKELNSGVYHMMDFRVSQKKATQFVYILPYSKNSALVELTRFGKELLKEDEAKSELDRFLKKYFGDYEVLDAEKGIIPMSSVLPKQMSKDKWVHIGTRAGNVKPSTGYAFKNMYNHARLICSNGKLKSAKVKINKRFHFYDQLLLIILTLWPKNGKFIFERLFEIKSARFVLKFLDEKTSFKEDLSMFSKLQIGLFVKAAFYWVFWRFKNLIFPFIMILYLLIDSSFPNKELFNLSDINLIVLIVGMLTIGIPHGALDHLTESINSNKKITIKFIIFYLLLMTPILLLWYWSPIFALLVFLIYSAWHFGSTETISWGIKNSFIGFLWGSIIFVSIFLTHYLEFTNILSEMSISIPNLSFDTKIIGNLILIIPLILAIYNRKISWVLMIIFFYLSSSNGLLLTFGLYFIFQHSVIGWMHLKNKLKFSHLKMYLNALPFNIGAIFLFLIFNYVLKLDLKHAVVYSFIFLSAISFPHVICMHLFYKKKHQH
tara:strand:+ start:1930 stop:3921 length:1992 start_codon:yes stop_codon:yes gene_type:complete